ncbi:hypothetical protein ACWCL1_08275 [Ligilactobacillus sp. LYQ135]
MITDKALLKRHAVEISNHLEIMKEFIGENTSLRKPLAIIEKNLQIFENELQEFEE